MSKAAAIAVSRRGLFSYEDRTLLILVVTGGVAGIDMLSLAFLTPFIVTDLHLQDSQIGSIVTWQLVAWSVGAMLASILSDQQGRRRIFLVVAMLLFAIFSVGSALAMSFLTLLAARFLVGLAEGPVIPMQSAIMLAASSPHRRGLNLGMVQNLGSQLLGAILGPILLIWVATHLGGWRNAFLIAGLPALVMAGIIHFGIREPSRPTSRPKQAPVLDTLRGIARVRNIRLTFIIGVFAVAWYGTLLTFLPLWVTRVLHFSPESMSFVMSSIGAAGAVSAVLVTGFSDRIGRRPAMVMSGLIGMGLPLGLLFAPADPVTVCLVVFGGGLFMGLFPLFISVVPMESVEARHGATALGLVMGCAQIVGGFAGPLLGGVLSDAWSLKAPIWMTVGLAFGAAVTSLFLTETAPRRLRGG